MPATAVAHTSDRILDIAERLVQVRGYNAFSYADIAAELRIQKAAVHYHFPSKDDLGKQLVVRYRARFRDLLAAIDRHDDARRRLRDYAQLYIDTLKEDERMCLCGMLAADFTTLPRPVRDEVRRFFDDHEQWLAAVLAAGLKAKQLRFAGTAEIAARSLLSSLEGAMLVARCHGEPARFRAVVERLLSDLEA